MDLERRGLLRNNNAYYIICSLRCLSHHVENTPAPKGEPPLQLKQPEETPHECESLINEDVRKARARPAEEPIFCVCRQPSDPTKFMLSCEFCNDWFHGECVSIGMVT